jgi:hypothetical protein
MVLAVPDTRRSIPIALVAALAMAGCGSTPSTQSGSGTGGHGDSATFTIDGRAIAVTQSGRTSVKIAGAPELTYNGPVGCKGRYFTANFSDGVPLFFRYSSHDAYLLLGSGLYYLGSAPQRTGGTLHWDSTVDGHQINVQVSCAPPPSSAPLVTSGVPQACDLVTRAIATSALRGKVGPPERVTEGPDTTYCAYKSSDGARRLELYVEKSAGLASGGSWAQPKITGIGDEAHGGSADSGLAARKGTLGIEVHVDLGFAADNAANVAAEDALARELIVELPG